MTPEQQRIEIAGACGFEFRKSELSGGADEWHDGSGYVVLGLPDFLNNLNDMHMAEKALTLDQRRTYWQHLQRITEKGRMAESSWLTTTATAAQRAEAFLKTIGKWAG